MKRRIAAPAEERPLSFDDIDMPTLFDEVEETKDAVSRDRSSRYWFGSGRFQVRRQKGCE